jgi:outer membrane protein assembly factor BamA
MKGAAWALAVALALATTAARADETELPRDYVTKRVEPAGFPILGGNSDIGLQVGGALTLTRFENDVRPYAWNMDLLVTASFKDRPGGTDVAQQSYLWQWDLPRLLGGRLRLTPLVDYQRTINQGYYGLGNASSPDKPAVIAGDGTRYFQYVNTEARARTLARYALGGPWQLAVGATFRAMLIESYAGSKLEQDNAAGTVRGDRNVGLPTGVVGVLYDTRDNEIFPRRGVFHQVGLRGAQGLPPSVNIQYGAVGASFVEYVRLAQDTVVAGRVLVDLEFGNVPFYDLYSGGPIVPYDMPGGPSGVRGVPSGRYLGPIKALANVEVRSLFWGFHLASQTFRIGGAAFADAGRVWSDYSFSSPLDGSGLGVKYGLGLGAFLLWGQAALFRVDVAYSPDASAENPGFPLGLYVEDGVMF